MQKTINIISRRNGVGLEQDISIVAKALEKLGYGVVISEQRKWHAWRERFKTRGEYAANIHIERAFPAWFGRARRNFLIPNQERFPLRHLQRLEKIDAILCKTAHAEKLFSAHAPAATRVRRIGFCSRNQKLESIAVTPEEKFNAFFHLAGKSSAKGTAEIISLWCRHPEWPQLTIVQNKKKAQPLPTPQPKNISLMVDYLSNEQLRELQNHIGIHLCPSRCEGWGHYLVEAMSTAAVVVTTDAPPMNELVSRSRGRLIPYKSKQQRKTSLDCEYFFDEAALEAEIERLIAMPLGEKQQLAENAAQWYLDLAPQFAAALGTAVAEQLA